MQRRFVLALLGMAAGCAMKVSGMVSDARTHRPVGGVCIRIENRVVYTSDVGVYLVKVHDSASATVEASAAGYRPASVTCPTPTRRAVCDVALEPAP